MTHNSIFLKRGRIIKVRINVAMLHFAELSCAVFFTYCILNVEMENEIQCNVTIYSLFSGYYKGELEMVGIFTFSRGFETFLSIFHPEL